MTRAHKPVRRLVDGASFGELVIEVRERTLRLRPKGTREHGPSAVEVPHGLLYQRLVEAALEEARRAKAKKRKRARWG